MTYANVPRRLAAFAIDMAFVWAFAALIQFLLHTAFGVSVANLELSGWQLEGLTLITLSLPTWAYFIGFESSAMRATPGKMLLRLFVADDDGGRLKRARVVLRTFVKMFPVEAAYLTFFIPEPWFSGHGRGEFRFGAFLVFGMGLMYLLITTWNDEHQSMHDLIAESFVLERSKPVGLFSRLRH